MLRAVAPLTDYRAVVAQAPSVPRDFYDKVIRKSGFDAGRVEIVEGRTFELLQEKIGKLGVSGLSGEEKQQYLQALQNRTQSS